MFKPVTFRRRADKKSAKPADAPARGTDKVAIREGWLVQMQDLGADTEAFEAIPEGRSI